MKNMTKAPSHLKELPGAEYSNFDGEKPKDIESVLKADRYKCTHPAWDHFGFIWYEDGRFHEQVWRHGLHKGTISGETIEEVFRAVNDKYGWE